MGLTLGGAALKKFLLTTGRSMSSSPLRQSARCPDPDRFLDECVRVLTPGGRLMISTPNKGTYTFMGRAQNPHHCSEMTEEEFSDALSLRFRDRTFYTQHPYFAPWWSPRTFVSDNTPWGRIRGFKRLRRAVQRLIGSEVVRDPTDVERTPLWS